MPSNFELLVYLVESMHQSLERLVEIENFENPTSNDFDESDNISDNLDENYREIGKYLAKVDRSLCEAKSLNDTQMTEGEIRAYCQLFSLEVPKWL